jgi:uncharacterized protein (TIRG00374 family)
MKQSDLTMRRKKSFWLRLILSLVLIAVVITTVDLDEIRDMIADSQPAYLLLAYLIAIGDRILMAYKWNILLRVRNIHISLFDATVVYLKTSFLGLFLPATVGGDALRAYAVAREEHNIADVISSILIERALGFAALFAFALISIVLSIFVFGQSFFEGIEQLLWLFIALLATCVVVVLLSFNTSLLHRIRDRVKGSRIANNVVARRLGSVYDSYQGYRGSKLQLVLFLILSLAENLFPVMWTYALSLAFGLDISLLYFFILVPIVLVLVRLPISLSGIGIQEGTFVYFLSLIGVAGSQALLLGAASNVIGILSILPGGIAYALNGFAKRGDKVLTASELPGNG